MAKTFEISFTKAVASDQLLPLLRRTYWASERSAEDVARALANSSIFLGAWDGEKLIGFARVLTDDVYRAVIDDVVVDEAYRGRGVGKAVMGALLARLQHVEEVFLGCADKEVPFYEKVGLHRAKNPYMKLRRQRH